MGCFVAPLTEAVVVAAAALVVKSREKKKEEKTQNLGMTEVKELSSTRLFRLVKLLLGGAVLLIFEHVWHGEVVPYFPFFTAVNEGEDAIVEMWHEIGTAGVTMAVLCTVAWGAVELLRFLFARKNQNRVVEE